MSKKSSKSTNVAKKNATKVAKTDDNVKQLVESIKGQRQLKEKEQQLRAARTNFRATEDTLAQLLPDSKCIHEEIEIVVP